jgi:hypothetical protein
MSKLDRDWLQVASGVVDDDEIDILRSFLQGRPLPTKTVRDAILHILLCGQDTLGMGRKLIAFLFDPKLAPTAVMNQQWMVDFKKTGKGHANPWRDTQIAIAIQAVRDCGKSYNDAIEWAVENFDIGERRAKQIYAAGKDTIAKLRVRSVESDG